MNAPNLTLLGRDYPELGPLGVVSLPEGGALSLSRGAYPKPYRHTDPNEDAALMVLGTEVALLAVADGHNGVATSERSIEFVFARAEALMAASGKAFEDLVASMIGELVASLHDVGDSRTCLVLATVRPTECQFALFGDCSVWRAGESAAQSTPNEVIIGPKLRLEDWSRGVWTDRFSRSENERVALVSDGITNFVPRPNELYQQLEAAEDDEAAAREVAEKALTGGAGDNVAVATISRLARLS